MDNEIAHQLLRDASALMGIASDLSVGVLAYLYNCLAFALRYFAVTGLCFFLLHIWFRERAARYRIQPAMPTRAQVAHEVRWAAANIAANSLSAVVLFDRIRLGYSSMYFEVADYGWWYFLASMALTIVAYDTWNYWQHRALHTAWLFRHIHWAHHVSKNPTAFASFAQHPAETLLGNTFFLLWVAFIPLHPMALSLAVGYMFATGINGHLGYEFYPNGFTRHPILGWINTSTHHNLHHSSVGYHYSSWFNWWDRICGTSHPRYHELFEAVKRQSTASALGHVGEKRWNREPLAARATECASLSTSSAASPVARDDIQRAL